MRNRHFKIKLDNVEFVVLIRLKNVLVNFVRISVPYRKDAVNVHQTTRALQLDCVVPVVIWTKPPFAEEQVLF